MDNRPIAVQKLTNGCACVSKNLGLTELSGRDMANSAPLDLSPKNWVATRQRLIAEGSLRYLDLAKFTEAELRSR